MKPDNFNSGNRLASAIPWEVVLLLVLWLVASQFAPATTDSVRDIYQANRIADGAGFPLQGPQLAHSVHLGPLWFYLLAVPAKIFDAWNGITLLVFLLSGMKFFLAYRLGRELQSPQLGLLFALFLALPNWNSTQLIIWTHTSVLETTLLLYLLALQRVRLTSHHWRWLLLGFTYALALHAHPTALPFILLVALVYRSLNWQRAGLLLLGVAVPFLPYGIDQLLSGVPDLQALQQYQDHEFSPGGLSEVISLLYSVVVVGPNLYYRTVLPGLAAIAAMSLHWFMVIVIASLGLLRIRSAEPDLKRLLLGGLLMLAAVIFTVIIIRGRTPWHLAYAPSFMVSFCLAVLAASAIAPKAWPRVRAIVSPLVIGLCSVVVAGTAQKLYSAELRFQEAVLYDVKNLSSPWGPSGFEIPAYTARMQGQFLCGQGPVVLHGPYAAIIDAHVGMEAKMVCGRRDHILIGGESDDPNYAHVAGVSPLMYEALGVRPEIRVGNVYIYSPLAVSAAGESIPLAEGDQNPPRRVFTGGQSTVQTLVLEAPVTSALLISKAVGKYLALDIHRVSCNGRPVEPALSSNYSWLYLCGSAATSSRWQAWYQASADHLIDAILLPVGPVKED